MIGYKIDAKANKENNLDLYVLFNGSLESQEVVLPEGAYRVLVNDQFADAFNATYIKGGSYVMPGSSSLVLEESPSHLKIGVDKEANNFVVGMFVVALIVIVVIGSVLLVRKIKNDNA